MEKIEEILSQILVVFTDIKNILSSIDEALWYEDEEDDGEEEPTSS